VHFNSYLGSGLILKYKVSGKFRRPMRKKMSSDGFTIMEAFCPFIETDVMNLE
jgi:hypothetical protein